MGKALIIGCGGVASVAIHKCCQNSEVFEEICIASRTKEKCDALKEKLEGTTKDGDSHCTGGRQQRERTDCSDSAGETGCGSESGPSVPGSDNYGRMSCNQDALRGHCEL